MSETLVAWKSSAASQRTTFILLCVGAALMVTGVLTYKTVYDVDGRIPHNDFERVHYWYGYFFNMIAVYTGGALACYLQMQDARRHIAEAEEKETRAETRRKRIVAAEEAEAARNSTI